METANRKDCETVATREKKNDAMVDASVQAHEHHSGKKNDPHETGATESVDADRGAAGAPDMTGHEDHGKKESHLTKKELAEALEKACQEKSQLSERLLRTLAEFDNYRKRVTREKEDLAAYGTEKFSLALLPVIDNFERACTQAHTAQDVQQVVQGVAMILKQLREVLERFNIKPFASEGEPFDPEKHEAMAQQEHDRLPANTVTAEIQKGYYIGERLLRPARVIVAKEPAKEDAQE